MEEEEDGHMEPGIGQGQGEGHASMNYCTVCDLLHCLCVCMCVDEMCQESQREGVSTEEPISGAPEQKKRKIELFFISQN